MKLSREFFIPKSAIKVVDKASDAVAYLYSPQGRPCAKIGRADQAAQTAGTMRHRSVR